MTREQFPALASGVELLERAVSYTLSSLQLVTVDALASPSPCAGWDLRSLLGHLDDSLAAITEAVELRVIDMEFAGVVEGTGTSGSVPEAALDPAASIRDRTCRILGAWANAAQVDVVAIGDHQVTGRLVSTTGALEVAVHGWDIARTCGARLQIPPGLAGELLEIAPLIVTAEDRPARFAAARCIPADSDASTRLLAFLGRAA